MKGKKILEFVLLKPAFSSRNLTSLLLVAIFFAVYVLAGGKVEIPDVRQGSNFGGVSQTRPVRAEPARVPVEQQTLQPSATSDDDPISELERRLKNLK
jgi:hypothetical protein